MTEPIPPRHAAKPGAGSLDTGSQDCIRPAGTEGIQLGTEGQLNGPTRWDRPDVKKLFPATLAGTEGGYPPLAGGGDSSPAPASQVTMQDGKVIMSTHCYPDIPRLTESERKIARAGHDVALRDLHALIEAEKIGHSPNAVYMMNWIQQQIEAMLAREYP